MLILVYSCDAIADFIFHSGRDDNLDFACSKVLEERLSDQQDFCAIVSDNNLPQICRSVFFLNGSQRRAH